jgi:hypothetical protein
VSASIADRRNRSSSYDCQRYIVNGSRESGGRTCEGVIAYPPPDEFEIAGAVLHRGDEFGRAIRKRRDGNVRRLARTTRSYWSNIDRHVYLLETSQARSRN